MENGNHAEAATLFERLARSTLDLGMSRRATFLLIQAARARFLGGQPEMGMAIAQEGLRIQADAGRWETLRRAGDRLTAELSRMGFPDQSQALSNWLGNLQQGKPIAAPQAQPQHPQLPVTCTQCGAIVRPDEVDWVDSQTAECAYCSSILTSE
jgi:hypothetical protein